MDSLHSCLAFRFFSFRFVSSACRCHGRSAIPPSGAPAASSTIVAMSGLACARAHGRSGRPSLSGVIDSTSSTSVAKSFSQDDLLALVWDKFAWLMQLQANPPLSVQLAPPGLVW